MKQQLQNLNRETPMQSAPRVEIAAEPGPELTVDIKQGALTVVDLLSDAPNVLAPNRPNEIREPTPEHHYPL
jgi:hypothetical protein